MIIYLLKSASCLALLLVFYHFVLEKEKMHNFNRFYLLGAVLFSFLAPLASIKTQMKRVVITSNELFSQTDYDKFRAELPFSGRYFWTLGDIDEESILDGIKHFESVLMHISEPKIVKRQKRNDNI